MEVNDFLASLACGGHEVADVKINHYTADRHNNGGYDEIWVQYTIIYK